MASWRWRIVLFISVAVHLGVLLAWPVPKSTPPPRYVPINLVITQNSGPATAAEEAQPPNRYESQSQLPRAQTRHRSHPAKPSVDSRKNVKQKEPRREPLKTNSSGGDPERSGVDQRRPSSAPLLSIGEVRRLLQHYSEPQYPRRALLQNIEGTCRLRIAVVGGRVKVAIARSSGGHMLDQAARRAAERWRFRDPDVSPFWVDVRFQLTTHSRT